MAKEKKINPTEIRLQEVDKEISELTEQRNSLIAHWNLEKNLIKTIRSSKEEIENLKAEADKYEREGNLAKVAEIRYGKLGELDKIIQKNTADLAELQKTNKMLKEEVDADKWLTRFWRKENKVEKKDFTTLNILSMAAHYSPKEKISENKMAVTLPCNLRTGEIDKKIWKKWKLHDPISMIDKFKDNLKLLDLLFFDCGIYDEFNLFIGTKIFSEKCKRLGINHEYNQFNGGHFNTSFRYAESLSRVYSSLSK